MEQGGGNKRRVVSASEGSEQPRIARNDDSGGATKKVSCGFPPRFGSLDTTKGFALNYV